MRSLYHTAWWLWIAVLAPILSSFVATAEEDASSSQCVDLTEQLSDLYESPSCALAVAMLSKGDLFSLELTAPASHDDEVFDAICTPPSCINQLNRMAERFSKEACPFNINDDELLLNFYNAIQGQQADYNAMANAYCTTGTNCYESLSGVPGNCGKTGFGDVTGDEWTAECFSTVECGTCLASWVDVWEGDNRSPAFTATFGIPDAVLEVAKEAASNETLCTEYSSVAATSHLHRGGELWWLWWGGFTVILLSRMTL